MMNKVKLFSALFAVAFAAACGTAPTNTSSNNSNTNAGNTTASPAAQNLTIVEMPQRFKDMMAARGEQDKAAPTLTVVEPKADSTVSSSTVKVKLNISGDLKGYKPHMDPDTKTGNHIHVILDNQPYEAYYNPDQEFELRNVSDGEHTLRVFPSRPWHESYKNEGAFQIVRFTVKDGGANTAGRVTTRSGEPLSESGERLSNAKEDTAAKPTPEGKDMQTSTAGAVDPQKPLLTYSRPKGEYKSADADPIMIDFWLENAKLKDDGGEYRVRYSIDGSEAKYIDKWAPIWLSGWTSGKHTIKLELVDVNGSVVDNGGYNSTTREINVVK